MASYLPPTENLPVFDNSVFETNNTTALTYATAKQYFLTYPTAQGASTITSLIAGSINYLSPSSGSFFDIGTNQVSGGTVRVGPTGGATGVSVHAGNIDFKNNTINNANNATGGDISLASAQTTGILNIGTAVRSGPINIGNTTSSTEAINIGVNGTTTTLDGIVTCPRGITLSSSYTPTTTQLGYNATGSGSTIASITTTISAACITISNIPVGIYIMTFSGNITSFSLTTNAVIPTISVTGGSNTITKYNIGSTTSTTSFIYSGPVTITSSTNTTTLQFTATAGTAAIVAVPNYSYIKIG